MKKQRNSLLSIMLKYLLYEDYRINVLVWQSIEVTYEHLQEDDVGLIENSEQAQKVSRIMENCVELAVPLVVDIELGRSWGETEETT